MNLKFRGHQRSREKHKRTMSCDDDVGWFRKGSLHRATAGNTKEFTSLIQGILLLFTEVVTYKSKEKRWCGRSGLILEQVDFRSG